MPAHTPYRRQSRSRQRRNAPKTDAVVVALTLQVIACVLLLVVALLAKKADETRYDQIHQQYNQMVNGSFEELGLPAIQAGGEGLQGVFDSLEGFITSLVNRFSGAGPVAGDREDPDLEEELEPPLNLADDSDGDGMPVDFDFNYLDASEVTYTGTRWGNIEPGGRGDTSQPAPEWATYAQVELLGKIIPPITGVITSEFSYRVHPVNGDQDFHNGMDIAAEEGRDVLAALPGEVYEVGESDIYGNYIILQHATNLRTFYAHCSEILATEGMAVEQGERIAKVGSTGMVTGSHLHFSVIVEGQYTDPYWLLKDNIKLVE